MTKHGSATALKETPHETETTQITINDDLKRRAQAVIKDQSTTAQWRNIIRYALALKDPFLPDLLRGAEAGEEIIDTTDLSPTPEINEDHSEREKIEALADIICGSGGAEAAGALFVLMGTLQNSTEPGALAHEVMHFAFTRCGELNLNRMVEAHLAIVGGQLLDGKTLVS